MISKDFKTIFLNNIQQTSKTDSDNISLKIQTQAQETFSQNIEALDKFVKEDIQEMNQDYLKLIELINKMKKK